MTEQPESYPDSLAEAAAQVEARKTTIDVSRDPELVLADVRKELTQPPKGSQPGQIGNEVFRNGVLVRIGRDDEDEPVLARHTGNTMSELLAQRITFGRFTGQGWSTVDPPGSIIGKVLDAPDVLDVPVVQQIVNAPVFGPDGELRTEPGLLRSARVWYEPTDGMMLAWEVPSRPSAEHLDIARGWISELLHDFPFAADADRAHAWALLIQPFVRPMIDGPTPLYVVEAPTAGTGKGKLVKAALTPALGYEIAAHPEPADREEWRKHLMAFLLKGKPVFFLDNVGDRLDAGVLSSALTERTMEDRVLGASRIVTMPVRCLWVMTANNPRLSQEIARRGVQIRLDAEMARPQLRADFRHPDLERWARENRGQLVWSALTLVQAWVAAGRPAPSEMVPQLGSFESWRRVVGGILRVAGHGEAFLANYVSFTSEHADDETDAVCAALDIWWSTFGDRPVTTSDLVRAVVPLPGGEAPVSLAALLLGPEGDGLTRMGVGVKLASRLRGLERRVLCEYRIAPAVEGRQRRYALRKSD